MKRIVEQHEEHFADDYTDGMVWLVKLFGIAGIVCTGLLATHVAFTSIVAPIHEQMYRDPMEVVD